jgi:hypothetical protein
LGQPSWLVLACATPPAAALIAHAAIAAMLFRLQTMR